MPTQIHLNEITVGIDKGDRVTVPIDHIKKIEVDLECRTAVATLNNNETIPITPEQAALLVHYNNVWRPL